VDAEKKLLFSHRRYVEPLLEYILEDFENSRRRFADQTIGGMVICDSSEQAKKLYEIFVETRGLSPLPVIFIL